MKHPINKVTLPSLTVDLLQENGQLIDNIFSKLWQQAGMKAILNRCGFTKRSGITIHHVVYTLSLWLWLKKDSIGMFARESLADMGKDVLYDTMNREDLNWRKCNALLAYKTYRSFNRNSKKAFVVDDTIGQRFGKKMPGISSHFDHTTGRHMMGQQVLTLGLSSEEGFIPLDSELFTSQVKAQPLVQPFKDGRCTVAKRYRVAEQETKPNMVASMVKRALRAGIEGDYLLADAWFGSKAILRLCEETSLVAILRMKKGKLKYRITDTIDGRQVKQELDAKALYQHSARKQWQRIAGQKYQAKVVDVEVNLTEKKKDPTKWIKVRLLFVRGTTEQKKAQVGKHDWALFLCTDLSMSATDILQMYALRWAIEVYFKEAKQHLGLLKEQSNHYAAYIASIHLSAIRFCILVMAKQIQGAGSVAQIRYELCGNSQKISFSQQLWPVFRAIITGALDTLDEILGDKSILIMQTIESHIQCFFMQVLQLDPKILRREVI
jgi:SRSO17 transposase